MTQEQCGRWISKLIEDELHTRDNIIYTPVVFKCEECGAAYKLFAKD